MYLFGSKIRRQKIRNKSARYRAKLKKKNRKRVARMGLDRRGDPTEPALLPPRHAEVRGGGRAVGVLRATY